MAFGRWKIGTRGTQFRSNTCRRDNLVSIFPLPSPPLLTVLPKVTMGLAVELFVADFLERRADLDYDSAAWVVTRVAKRCERQGSGIKQDK